MGDPVIRTAAPAMAGPVTSSQPVQSSSPSGQPAPGTPPPASPATPAASPQDTTTPPPATGKAQPAVSLTAGGQPDNGGRFAIGLAYTQIAPSGFAESTGMIHLQGTYSRAFAGSAEGNHAAMVYQAGIGAGGRSDSLHVIDLAATVAIRGAVAVTAAGSQVYGQIGPGAHVLTAGDNGHPVGTQAGVGGRVEAGYAWACGGNEGNRLQVGVFAEAGMTGVEYGIGVRAATF